MGQFFLLMSQAGFQGPRTEIRNGLFIFKYTGPHSEEMSEIEFLEGSSNLGDAIELNQSEEEQ